MMMMMMLRRLLPHWSAILLAASLLFCAAVILGPLAAVDVSRRPGLSQGAQHIELRANAVEPVAGIGKTVRGLKLREDTPVIDVSTGPS